jgi:hypothetical protein
MRFSGTTLNRRRIGRDLELITVPRPFGAPARLRLKGGNGKRGYTPRGSDRVTVGWVQPNAEGLRLSYTSDLPKNCNRLQ